MQFFVERLPEGRMGTDGKSIWRDIKTVKGAVKRAEGFYGKGNFALWTFTEFYKEETFRRVV